MSLTDHERIEALEREQARLTQLFSKYRQVPIGRLEIAMRADDLGPAVAPNFSPELLRRVVRGERGRGPLGPLGSEWAARKMTGGLLAPARLLCTYADPSVGHDGATYAAAGAVDCGLSLSGKRLFCWALDPVLDEPLRKYAAAKRDIDRERTK